MVERPHLPLTQRLTKKNKSANQHDLTAQKRTQKLKGAYEFTSVQNLFGKSVLLVDEIITTGATIEECAQHIKKNGAKDVYALSFLVSKLCRDSSKSTESIY